MNTIELIDTAILLEEKVENSLLLLDIDETLLKPKNIYIYRKLPSDKKEVALTPEEYAKEKITADKKSYYSYRDFRNADTVAKSIKTGIPIIPNLKIMDDYIQRGWKIGILTARGMEDVIFNAMKVWLMFRDKKGELQEIGDKLVRNLIHAINDDEKKYLGKTDFDKKVNVIKNLSKKYNQIIFIDDDLKNIKAVKQMLKKEEIKNVYVSLATSGVNE